jgi:hypothetical protein
VKLPKRFKWTLYSVLSLAFISGGLWFAFERWVRVAGPLGQDHHPAQEWFLRVHGTVAYATLLCLGYMIRVHIQPGLKGKRARTSGVPMMFYFGALIITALIQLYWTDSPFRDGSATLHSYMGLVLPIFLITHIVLGRYSRKTTSQHARKVSAAVMLLTLLWATSSFGDDASSNVTPGRDGGSAQDLLNSKPSSAPHPKKPGPTSSSKPSSPSAVMNSSGNNFGSATKAGLKLPF